MSLEHRRFLRVGEPRASADLFQRVGGQPAVDRFVDALYDGLTGDAGLAPLFDGDRSAERARQKRFFAEWLGGPALWSQRAWGGLAHRHAELALTRAHAGRWLRHFNEATAVFPEAERARLFAEAQGLAFALVEGGVPPGGKTHGVCLSSDHPLVLASEHARRGEVAALMDLEKGYPALLARPLHAARILHAAVVAGREDAVKWLLERGVSPDGPAALPVGDVGVVFELVILLTPIAAARWRKRPAVAALLGGAHDDIFTAAFLGDEAGLAGDPQARDPALDVLEITPVHHAVAGRREAAFARLLRGAAEVRGAVRALRGAAAIGSQPMVARLLALGAEARQIGTGRWVLDPVLAPLLAAAGATVDLDWIGASCTGNQGRRDDPDYVAALLRHGARVDDRRPGSAATALHHAARAGFLRTIALLLEGGADPDVRDADGATPLDWLGRAAKSVDRAEVRRLLTARRGTGR